MSDDFISTISRMSGDEGLDGPNPFPDIPDPPPGFNPEEHPLFKTSEEHVQDKPLAQKFTPRVRVFVVTEEGNDALEELLNSAANGKIILGRKEIADIKGTPAYKVYQEWLIPSAKKIDDTGL